MKTKLIKLLLSSTVFLLACNKTNNESQAQRRDITETVFASGTLEPENKYNLTAQTDGYITELHFDSGDILSAGEVVAVVDNKTSAISAGSAERLFNLADLNASPEGPTLKQARLNVKLLGEKAAQDSLQYSRYQKLIQSNSISRLELENAKLAYETSKTNFMNAEQNYKLLSQQTEQQLITQRSQRDVNSVSNNYNEIKAVLGGKLYKRYKEVGDYVRRGDVIAMIGDANELYARINIDESNISVIKSGQPATVQLNTDKSVNYDAFVSKILPAFDDASQSFICEVKFKNKPAFSISGTQLQANIVIGKKNKALVIPRQFLDFGNKVLIKGTKEPVVIKTGFISSEWVEVLDGLTESDVILNPNK